MSLLWSLSVFWTNLVWNLRPNIQPAEVQLHHGGGHRGGEEARAAEQALPAGPAGERGGWSQPILRESDRVWPDDNRCDQLAVGVTSWYLLCQSEQRTRVWTRARWSERRSEETKCYTKLVFLEVCNSERKERPYDPKNYCKSYLYERTQDEKKIPTKQGNKINLCGEWIL